MPLAPARRRPTSPAPRTMRRTVQPWRDLPDAEQARLARLLAVLVRRLARTRGPHDRP